MKVSEGIADLRAQQGARAKKLTPRRDYPTIRLKPFRRGPLSRLAWIFGLSR